MTRSAGSALVASWGVTVATALPPALAAAMSAQILRELAVSHAAFGFAIGSCFLANAIVSPMAGRLVDRLGDRNSIRLSTVLVSLSLLGIAFFGGSYPAFVAFFTVGGFAMALSGPAGSVLLTGAAGLARQPLLFGVRQALVPAASLLSGAAVPVLTALTLGWRWGFFIGGVLVLALLGAGPFPARRRIMSLAPTTALYRANELWLLALVFALAGSAAMAFTSFVADYAVSRGMTADTGGIILAIGSAAAVVTRIAMGYVVGRWRIDALEATAVMLLVGVGGLVWVLLGSASTVLPAAILVLAGGWGWMGLVLFSVTFGFGDNPGRANGIVQTGGAAGGIIGPVVVGIAVERLSYGWAWGVAASLMLVAASILAIVCVRRRMLRAALR